MVCHIVLSRREGVDKLDPQELAEKVEAGWHLQVISDGGFSAGLGSCGVVVVAIAPNPPFDRAVIGYRGLFLNEAVSAFQAEIVAAEFAVQVVAGIRPVHKKKRLRFYI